MSLSRPADEALSEGPPMLSGSLHARLTWLTISLLFLVLVPVGVYTYLRELRAIDALLDARLAQAGHTVGAQIVHGATRPVLVQRAATVGPLARTVIAVDTGFADPTMGYQAFDSEGAPIVQTADFEGLPPPTAADFGFRTMDFKGVPWRMFTQRGASGLLLRMGERFDTRQDITRSLVIEHSLPLIIVLPPLALLIGFAVRQGLRPLARLTRLLRERRPGTRDPVVMPEASTELRPLIATLNEQFERLEGALERERQFNADVAHELRTPLTAAMIQLESAALATERTTVDAAMANAQLSLGRLARRIEQILELARLEAGAAAGGFARCDLVAIVKDTLDELAPLIADKDIAIGFAYDPQADASVPGHVASLTALFRNLIENAMRYGRPGGLVEITLTAGEDAVEVLVRDDGPGIPAERRAFVFDRFHRESLDRNGGSGLGLSIVQRAAQRHGATVRLGEPDEGSGLVVRVALPRTAPT